MWDKKSPTEESGTLESSQRSVEKQSSTPWAWSRRSGVPAAVAGGSSRDNVVEVKVAKRSAWISKWLHTAGTMELGDHIGEWGRRGS